MFSQADLLKAVSSRSMDFKNHVEPILASLLKQGIYITARNNNGVSIYDILFRFQVPAFLSAINLHNDSINKRRQSTIPTHLLQSIRRRRLSLPQIQESYLQHREMDINFLVGMAIDVGCSVNFIRGLTQLDGFNPDALGKDGEPLIHIAAKKGNIAILRLLVENQANYQVRGVECKTLLHSASAVMNPELLIYFLRNLDFHINARDYNGQTLLHAVINIGNIQGFRAALNFDPDLSAQDREGITPYNMADEEYDSFFMPKSSINQINNSRREIKQALINHLQNIEKRRRILRSIARNAQEINLAHLGLNFSHLNSIREALRINTEQLDISGNYLDNQCADELINLLIPFNRLVRIDCQDNSFSTNIEVRIRESVSPVNRLRSLLENSNTDSFNAQVETIKFYVDHDREVLRLVMEDGWMLTHYCVMYGNIDLLEFLSEKSMNFFVNDSEGRNLLDIAILHQREEVALWLIKEVKGLIRHTPKEQERFSRVRNAHILSVDYTLVAAVKNGLSEVVLELLSLGETVGIDGSSNNNEPLLLLAAKNFNEHIVKSLLKYGSVLTKELFDQIIEECSDRNDIEKIKELFTSYLSKSTFCFDLVLRNEPKQLVDYLDSEDFDIQALNENEHTLLHVALELKFFECAAILISRGAERTESEKSQLPFGRIVSDDENKVLIQFSLKYFSRPKKAIVDYFSSRSRLVIERKRASQRDKKIKSFFKSFISNGELSEKYLVPILEIIESGLIKVDIVFDFNKDNVENMNLSSSAGTRGVTSRKSGKIYIGAKREKHEICGTLIHELCHFAMQLLYDNCCDPFSSNEINEDSKESLLEGIDFSEYSATSEKFLLVLNSVKEKISNVEDSPSRNIVALAFDYSEALHPSELIVRVPHVIAQFGNEGFNFLQSEFPELLEYYEKVVLSDLSFYLNQKKMQNLRLEVGEKEWLRDDVIETNSSLSSQSIFSHRDKPEISVLHQDDFSNLSQAT